MDINHYLAEALTLFPADPVPAPLVLKVSRSARGANVCADPNMIRLRVAFQSFKKKISILYPARFASLSFAASHVLQSSPRPTQTRATSNIIHTQMRSIRNIPSSASRRIRRFAAVELPSDDELIELERLAILKAPSDRARLQAKHDKIVAETRRLIQLRLI
ncbi:UNVERIFIED_CONTAM: hypothetical protein HDU68_012303 [Siphonaria sp. JEL0065]|nr:hypothetical protein HDU68_012303 [Siphonaria sp. JEL0065]